MSWVDKELACISPARIARPNAASYESSCAEARTDPSSGYFEPDDQPASMTPYTPRPDIARMNNAPTGRSATWRNVAHPGIDPVPSLGRPPIGTTQNIKNGGMIDRYAESRNTGRSAVCGIDCS